MPHLQITVKPFSSAEKLLWYFLLFSALVKANFHILPLNRPCQKNIFQSDLCSAPLLILTQTCTMNATSILLFSLSVDEELRPGTMSLYTHVKYQATHGLCALWMVNIELTRLQTVQAKGSTRKHLSEAVLCSVKLCTKCCMRANNLDEKRCFYSSFAWSLGKDDPGF